MHRTHAHAHSHRHIHGKLSALCFHYIIAIQDSIAFSFLFDFCFGTFLWMPFHEQQWWVSVWILMFFILFSLLQKSPLLTTIIDMCVCVCLLIYQIKSYSEWANSMRLVNWKVSHFISVSEWMASHASNESSAMKWKQCVSLYPWKME